MRLDAEIVMNEDRNPEIASVEFQMLITAYNLRDGRKIDNFHCTKCGEKFGRGFQGSVSSVKYPPFQDHFPDCPQTPSQYTETRQQDEDSSEYKQDDNWPTPANLI